MLSYLAVSGSLGTHGLARQASLSMELDLPNPVIKPTSRVSCIGKWILYHCAIWEGLMIIQSKNVRKKKNKTKP